MSEEQERDLEDLLRDVPTISLSRKTINQVVAYNLQTARRARAWTQDELAAKLEDLTDRPWTAATLGAAERSWESGRIRKFDANELVAFSRAFGLPVAYFLLPPEDNEETEPDDEGNQPSGSGHMFSTGVTDGEFKPGSFVRVDEMMEAIEPFRPPPQFIDRVKRAMLKYMGVDWKPGRRTMQVPTQDDELTPELELSHAELALESTRAQIDRLMEDLRREREHQLHLFERVGRAKSRLERRELGLSGLLDHVQQDGRENTEKEIARIIRRFDHKELVDRGWPMDYRGEPHHYALAFAAEAARQLWPDLGPMCEEALEKIRDAEEWWPREGRRAHDIRMRDLIEAQQNAGDEQEG